MNNYDLFFPRPKGFMLRIAKAFSIILLLIWTTLSLQVPALGQSWEYSDILGKSIEFDDLLPHSEYLILPNGTGQEIVTIKDGMNLSGKDLTGQLFTHVRIEDANFSGANLSGADFRQGVFVRCDFSNANLSNVEIDSYTKFIDCNFDGFIYDRWWKEETTFDFSNVFLTGANSVLSERQSATLTRKQLAQSMNARLRNYANLRLRGNGHYQLRDGHYELSVTSYLDFKGYDFSNSLVSDCNFSFVDFTGASFDNAALRDVSFDHCVITLDQIKSTWNYRNGQLDSVELPSELQREIDWEEFLNSQSLKQGKLLDEEYGKDCLFARKQLQSIEYAKGFGVLWTKIMTSHLSARISAAREKISKCFYYLNIDGWDLSGMDLSDSIIVARSAQKTNFTDAKINGAHFQRPTVKEYTPGFNSHFRKDPSRKIGKEQLESTASYKQKSLQGVQFGDIFDLDQVDFSGCDLSNSIFLTDLKGAKLTDAVITGCIFADTYGDEEPIVTSWQIRSTWNFKTGHMEGIVLPSRVFWQIKGE